MNIIFLDIDGVLSDYDSGYNISAEKIEMLRKIMDETSAKIVMSSSWRYGTLEETKKKYYNLPFINDLIGVTPRFSLFDGDDYFSIPRGVEIKHWLTKHEEEVDNYVILDDDLDMLLEQKDNFVHTDTYKGLSEDDMIQAIKILKGKKL